MRVELIAVREDDEVVATALESPMVLLYRMWCEEVFRRPFLESRKDVKDVVCHVSGVLDEQLVQARLPGNRSKVKSVADWIEEVVGPIGWVRLDEHICGAQLRRCVGIYQGPDPFQQDRHFPTK